LADRYTLERELGRGGMAIVYLAHDVHHDRPVALKVLHPELAASLGPERFLREIQLTARLQHPHILPVHDSGEAAGRLWYTMPFVEGESLRDRLHREKQLPLEDALQIARHVLAALAYAHNHGVIHRDIKPENILLEAGEAVVADFGIAHALDAAGGERLTETGLAVGTPVYMSPEQAGGERGVGAQSDIYSLGTVLYEMLAGEPPFTGPNAQVVIARRMAETPRGIRVVRDTVPESVERAVQRALARVPADRFATAAEFAAALAPQTVFPAPAAPRRRPKRRVFGVAIVSLGILGALAATQFLRPVPAPTLDANLVAVAPFDVLAPGLALWREGLVDLLSRNLDGAGPLRTVPPSVVIGRWTGRADPPSATRLGRKTGAKLAVFGQLLATRADSVRLTATLFDVATERPLGEFEFRELGASMDRLADSLTVALLRELGRARPIGAVPATALRSTSLPALKAFLQGEQFFRRTAWDSALASYRRAVTIDSGLALAWRRMSQVVGWQVIAGDSLSEVYGLRAAALNRGLPPRESLLVTAESLTAALYTASADTAWRAHQARLFATLAEATRRYPEDPEVWFELGDSRFHFRPVGQTSLEQVLEPFDRAVAADPAFGESYIHAVWLALQLGRPELARRYIADYFRHNPGEEARKHIHSFQLVEQLLADSAPRASELARLIDTSSTSVLIAAYWAMAHWPDSQETATRLARAVVASRPSGVPLYDDQGFRTGFLRAALAHRGHLREAFAVGGNSAARGSKMAVLGGVPEEAAAALFQRWLEDPPLREQPSPIPRGFNLPVFDALPWWAARHDTTSLAAFAARMKATTLSSHPDVLPWLHYGSSSAEAYLALARGDTTSAVERFANLPDTVCPCMYDQIVAAQLLLARGRDRDAARVFEGQTPDWQSPAEGLWRLQRARAFERLGKWERAQDDYRFVVALWRHGDPELQSYVTEARQALTRLTAEPGP
jgi:serine/threonine-protein kinase